MELLNIMTHKRPYMKHMNTALRLKYVMLNYAKLGRCCRWYPPPQDVQCHEKYSQLYNLTMSGICLASGDHVTMWPGVWDLGPRWYHVSSHIFHTTNTCCSLETEDFFQRTISKDSSRPIWVDYVHTRSVNELSKLCRPNNGRRSSNFEVNKE